MVSYCPLELQLRWRIHTLDEWIVYVLYCPMLSLSVSKMQCACSSVVMTVNKKISEEESRCLKEKS